MKLLTKIKTQTYQSIQHKLLDALLLLIVLIAIGTWTQVRIDLYEHQEQGNLFQQYLQARPVRAEAPEPTKDELAEMTTEEYICSFDWDCKTALAVATAESGMRCDAQNINKGTNSLDLGLFQINSVHLRKGWKVAELLDCTTNINRAYEIYKGSGWQAWSAYKNQSYKRHLN